MVALEAMERARPVIAAAIGGLEDLVRDGETGLLVRPGDSESLAEAMLALAADPARAAAMGLEARRRAIERFPELRCTERTEEVYRHWLEVRRAGALEPARLGWRRRRRTAPARSPRSYPHPETPGQQAVARRRDGPTVRAMKTASARSARDDPAPPRPRLRDRRLHRSS